MTDTAVIWSLVREIEGLQYQETEHLSYDTYEGLSEYVTKLVTLANVIDTINPLAYTYDTVQDAQRALVEIQDELARRG